MYVELYQLKKHLNIDETFTDDDEYILSLCDAAESAVERHIDFRLEDIAENNGGNLPSPLIQAILLMVGNLYANREAIAFATPYEVPLAYNYLLDLYKNYSLEHNS